VTGTNDRGTLERIQTAIEGEARELEADPTQQPQFIAGMRYAAAFVGGQLTQAVDIQEMTLVNAANLADQTPAMSRFVSEFLLNLAQTRKATTA
jgi:hypothetical protein